MSLNLVDVFVLYLLMQKGECFRPTEHTGWRISFCGRHLRNHSP